MYEERRRQLVQQYSYLVDLALSDLNETIPATVDKNQLIKAGEDALSRVALHYCESRTQNGNDFVLHAKYIVRNAMLDILREIDWVPRGHDADWKNGKSVEISPLRSK